MKLLFSLLAQGGAGKLTTLIFHRVTPAQDELFPGEVDAIGFDRICGWLASWFRVLPLDQAVQLLRERRLPARALCITFDDGYADNHDVALPVLQRHGLVATFFVATGFLDGGRMWNDTIIESLRHASCAALDLADITAAGGVVPLANPQARRQAIDTVLAAVKYLPPDERAARVALLAERAAACPPGPLMMRPAQVAALHAAGMQIGAHTVNHPILRSLSTAESLAEMRDSRDRLQSITGRPVTLFAYPNGKPGQDYDGRDAELARECGFAAAVSTAPGVATADSDLFQLPRFTPWRRTRTAFAAQLGRNLLVPA